MKKAFKYSLVAFCALMISATLAHAQSLALVTKSSLSTKAALSTSKTQASAQAATDTQTKDQSVTPTTADTTVTTDTTATLASHPLTVRKAQAETDLTALYTQFSLFVGRTQTTIDQLTAKNIDTTKAQTELSASAAALTLAKTNLDALVAITVTDTPPEQDTTELKATLKKIEIDLKDARTHLIQSLTVLKASVTLSINAQQ